MQYRLTRQAEKAIEFARDIAEELQHNYIVMLSTMEMTIIET